MNAKQRHRIHQTLSDVVLLELWLAEEVDGEPSQQEIEDAFCRIQSRMLVVQAILWPDEQADEEDWLNETGPYQNEGST